MAENEYECCSRDCWQTNDNVYAPNFAEMLCTSRSFHWYHSCVHRTTSNKDGWRFIARFKALFLLGNRVSSTSWFFNAVRTRFASRGVTNWTGSGAASFGIDSVLDFMSSAESSDQGKLQSYAHFSIRPVFCCHGGRGKDFIWWCTSIHETSSRLGFEGKMHGFHALIILTVFYANNATILVTLQNYHITNYHIPNLFHR